MQRVWEMEDPGSLLETGRSDSWRMVEKEKVGRSWTALLEQFPEIMGSLRVLRRRMFWTLLILSNTFPLFLLFVLDLTCCR